MRVRSETSGRGALGKIAQEGTKRIGAEISRVSFPMKMDVAADPLQISVLRADAVMLDPDDLAYALEQARLARRCR